MKQTRRNVAQLRLLNRYQRAAEVANLRMYRAKTRGELVNRLTWFQPPAAPKLTAGRVAEIHGIPKRFVDCEPASESSVAWLNRELHRPSHSSAHRTVRFAGKPYHWRQDYTGQLKLAAGESPW